MDIIYTKLIIINKILLLAASLMRELNNGVVAELPKSDGRKVMLMFAREIKVWNVWLLDKDRDASRAARASGRRAVGPASLPCRRTQIRSQGNLSFYSSFLQGGFLVVLLVLFFFFTGINVLYKNFF